MSPVSSHQYTDYLEESRPIAWPTTLTSSIKSRIFSDGALMTIAVTIIIVVLISIVILIVIWAQAFPLVSDVCGLNSTHALIISNR